MGRFGWHHECLRHSFRLGCVLSVFFTPAVTAQETAERPSFSRSYVQILARRLAREAFQGTASRPEVNGGSDSRRWPAVGANNDAASTIALSAASPWFELHPMPNFGSGPEMDLYLVEDGRPKHFAFDQAAFASQGEKTEKTAPRSGFGGIRFAVRLPARVEGEKDGGLHTFGDFRASGLFGAAARGQIIGPTARPLKVRWQDVRGEETAAIRTLWVERPATGATGIVAHALLDAPSFVAACQFTLRPGSSTLVDTECMAYWRADIALLGLAPIQGAHFIGPMAKPIVEDVRPQVHEVNGLEMLTGGGERIWRPVANRTRLEVSSFQDNNPQGFGLLQSVRSPESFLDDENNWQKRPSVWVEPLGEWGEGSVVLQEIPAHSAHNKNIVVYWRPNALPKEGGEMAFAYRQYWGWGLPDKPGSATVVFSRIGRSVGKAGERRARFLVQFEGGDLGNPEIIQNIVPSISATEGKVLDIKVVREPELERYRVQFDLDSGGETASELRLTLTANGTQKSETWLFRWTQ